MGTSSFVGSAITPEVRTIVRRVGLALGLGFLLFVAVPTTMAVALALSGGHGLLPLGLLAFGALGFLLVLVALPVATIGVAWVLVGSIATEVDSAVTDRRLRVLRWAETAEETRWWGPLVRPAERLAFVDPMTPAERLEADLEDAKSRYVVGALSLAAFERRLDRLFGIEPDGSGSDGPDELATGAAPGELDGSREDERGERLAR